MTMESDCALLDANILVYATDSTSDHHATCRKLCEQGTSESERLFVTPQILAEFIAVVTNPNVLSAPLTPPDACAQAEAFVEAFSLVAASDRVFARVLELLRLTNISGKRVHDVLHAATMLENGIARIYTYDAGFERIPGITVARP